MVDCIKKSVLIVWFGEGCIFDVCIIYFLDGLFVFVVFVEGGVVKGILRIMFGFYVMEKEVLEDVER